MEMTTIKRILSGSCTPASDLLVHVKHYGMDEKAALDALNARLAFGAHFVSLHDAAQIETEFQRTHDC